VFFSAGDTHLDGSRDAAQLRDEVMEFVQRVNRDLPKTIVEGIPIKLSPWRAQSLPALVEANGLIEKALANLPKTGFTDVNTPMLGDDGQPRASQFREDKLHIQPEGYAIWHKASASQVQCRQSQGP
jgi:lysophospholipase L1-like esterase